MFEVVILLSCCLFFVAVFHCFMCSYCVRVLFSSFDCGIVLSLFLVLKLFLLRKRAHPRGAVCYVRVIPWVVRLYVEIIHEL